MANGLAVMFPPAVPVYRISRGTDLFAPAPWDIADPDDGTFRGRFDDPGKLTGADCLFHDPLIPPLLRTGIERVTHGVPK